MLYSDNTLEDQGLMSRVLVSKPETMIGEHKFHEPKPVSLKAMKAYGQIVSDILAEIADELKRPDSRDIVFALSNQARPEWIRFHDSYEKRFKGDLSEVTNFTNKMPQHVLRLAAVIAMARQSEHSTIDLVDIEAAIELAKYYTKEVLRLRAESKIDKQIKVAQDTLEWMVRYTKEKRTEDEGDLVLFSEVCQYGPAGTRGKKNADAALRTLADHYCILPVNGPIEVDDKQRRGDVWRIHPNFIDNND
jgi:hypothetical protein